MLEMVVIIKQIIKKISFKKGNIMKKIIFFILFAGLNINVFAQLNNAMLNTCF